MARLFEERERAAELIFARDEEARFVARCRRMRGLAWYAANKLGVDARAAEAYAAELVASLVQGVRDEDLLERIQADLAANGVIETLGDLRAELVRLGAQASVDQAMPPVGEGRAGLPESAPRPTPMAS
ncbi:ATPase inhibitor subunit zeta [Methylobacterium durans]|uniref:ATPase inhibitor subunit zeta n=1 Tax=Methylobacterium durans TaxID=2202825 RepID=UPI002AFDDE09|nr:ATPase inhibitor subunit zeta [Methylobacterium durans]MEA1834992.1 ATPase inhibitor subunit zeta [Methylobacterium durans]